MRLGSYPCSIRENTKAFEIYKKKKIFERHRHRFEFNNKYRQVFEQKGMTLSGINEEDSLVEIIEITKHPWFVGVQFHPEFQSKPFCPHPLFLSFIGEACTQKKLKKPYSFPQEKELDIKTKPIEL